MRVTPEAYYLFDAAAVGVPELCDAFKVRYAIHITLCNIFLFDYPRHLHESQNLTSAAGSKTPFGAGTRTPARPGGATPGRMSVRQVGRTPNPYSGTTPGHFTAPPPPNAAAYPPPPASVYGMPPQTPYGHQTPSHRPPNFPPPPPVGPPGMNPARAAMLQQNTSGTGWGQNSGWP